MKQKILLFESRELCYESNRYFMNRLEEAFLELGYPVHICDLSEEQEEKLEALLEIKEQFLAAVDFNSLLPRMVMEDGTPYLDELAVPFYNYIVDHPLYHHPGLIRPVKDYHVVCIDNLHAAYVRQYYPNVKSVHVVPLGGMEADYQRSQEQKRFELLFLGTYVSVNQLYEDIENLDSMQRMEVKELIQRMEADVSLTQEGAFAALLRDKDAVLDRETFAVRLNLAFLADKYIRYARRKSIIMAAAEAEIPFTIIGHGWEQVDFPEGKQPILKSGVGFAATAELIADAKVLLNVTPGFYGGMHDRVFSAMLNHAVSLNEDIDFAKKSFEDGKDIVLYDRKQLQMLPDQISRLLENDMLREDIAAAAFQTAQEHFTWRQRAKKLISIMER